jgi:hypothetical protein
VNSATEHTILTGNIINGIGSVPTAEVIIDLEPIGKNLQGKSEGTQVTTGRESVHWGYNLLNGITNGKITSIQIMTSTSTWKAGTIIEVYGVKK